MSVQGDYNRTINMTQQINLLSITSHKLQINNNRYCRSDFYSFFLANQEICKMFLSSNIPKMLIHVFFL